MAHIKRRSFYTNEIPLPLGAGFGLHHLHDAKTVLQMLEDFKQHLEALH